jgi:DNA-binding IclR family transcriptional regulator
MATVPAARQTLDILAFLSRQAGPVPAAAIVRELSLPRSTVYHLLDTLAEQGFVTHLPEDRRYALGLAAYELGTGYARQAPLARLSRVPLAELADRAGHAAHLAVLHGREVVYVVEERAPGQPPLVTDVGVRLPAALTASGRAILARLPAAQLRALYPDPSAFVLRTDSGPGSLSALRTLLVETRRRGYAVESGEVSEGFASTAAPVLDHTGHPVAAVAVTFPLATSPNDTDDRIDRLATLVNRTATTITRRIGGTGVATADAPGRSLT